MARFRFYHIHEKYIRFLHSGDSRVQYNKNQKRPYVGIVLKIKGADYYVPLESPKPNHKKIGGGGVVLKMEDGKLGIIGFNNMIPVPNVALLPFDFANIEDTQYRNLLFNQLEFCNKNRELILQRARHTYSKRVKGEVAHYNEVCCDFKKLERMCSSYDPEYRPKR